MSDSSSSIDEIGQHHHHHHHQKNQAYVYHIHLRPLLVVKNNLPVMLRYHHSITPRSDAKDFHDLPPGEEVSLYALKDAEEGHGDLSVKVGTNV